MNKITGLDLVAGERNRQIYAYGYDFAHDAQYTNNELIDAADCYVQSAQNAENGGRYTYDQWPFDGSLPDLTETPQIERLVIAAAFLVAEIDRLLEENNSHAHQIIGD